MKLKMTSKSGLLPQYETEGASGADIRAYIDEPVVIKPGKRALIPTGLTVEIPKGYEIQIRARSGLALKHGIALMNGIGTIDSDYRGELGVILINLGEEDFTVNNGDRIAQMVLSSFEKMEIIQVNELNETLRDSGGFGSTGI